MAEETKVTTPEGEKDKGQETEAPKLDELIQMLESADITTTEALEGKLKASAEVGRMAQLLGDERKAREQAEQRARALESERPRPQQLETDYTGLMPQAGTIDLTGEIKKAIREERDAERQEAVKLQVEVNRKYQKIYSDKNFAKVKDIWDEKAKDPGFLWQIQSGVVDPVDAYREVVDEYKDGLLRKTLETIKQMQGKGTVTPPHMETGEQVSANLVSGEPGESDQEKLIKRLREKKRPKLSQEGEMIPGESINYEDELAVIDTLFQPPPGAKKE